MTLPPAVTIHGAPHLAQALAPGHPVLLLSAPGAASYAGAGWWHALTRGHAAALDCAEEPGRALEALALGCPIVILHPCPAWPGIAARRGTTLLLAARPPSLDLAAPGAASRLARWLDPAAPPPMGDSARRIR